MGGFKCYLDQLVQKKIENNKKKYRTDIDECAKYILFLLGKIEETGHYLDYVASVKAVITEDYADTFPYEDMSTNEILEYIHNLEGLKEEALGVLSEAKKVAERKIDYEIGKASLGTLGIESIDELDDALVQQHEKKQGEAKAKKEVFAAAMGALNGKSGSLADIFLQDNCKKTDDGDDDN